MALKEFDGTVSSDFQGNKIPEIKFKYEAEIYDSYDSVPAEEKLTAKDMLQAVNAGSKAAAVAKKRTEVLTSAGYRKPDSNDPETIRANMVKLNMKLYGIDEETAKKIVAMAGEAAQAVKV